MSLNEKVVIDEKKLDEIEKRIIRKLEKYIDEKLEPVLKHFRKNEDFYDIKFL